MTILTKNQIRNREISRFTRKEIEFTKRNYKWEFQRKEWFWSRASDVLAVFTRRNAWSEGVIRRTDSSLWPLPPEEVTATGNLLWFFYQIKNSIEHIKQEMPNLKTGRNSENNFTDDGATYYTKILQKTNNRCVQYHKIHSGKRKSRSKNVMIASGGNQKRLNRIADNHGPINYFSLLKCILFAQ